MIPTFKRADHFGVTVPDVEKATQFFQKILGAKSVGTASNFSAEDDWMSKHLDVHPRSLIRKIEMLELPDGFRIELFEYHSPEQNQQLPKNADFGGHHLCFEVNDIDIAIAYLREEGIKILGESSYNDPAWDNIEGSFSGIRWIYFQTPWRLNLELLQKPRS